MSFGADGSQVATLSVKNANPVFVDSAPQWEGNFRRAEIPPVDAQSEVRCSVSSTEQGKNEQSVYELGARSGRTGQATILATATLILVRNERRRALKVTNLGAVDVFIGFSPSVAAISGDLLVGTRGSFIVIPTTQDVYAIVASGTGSVSFMEISE